MASIHIDEHECSCSQMNTHKAIDKLGQKIPVVLNTDKEIIVPNTQGTPRNQEDNDQKSGRKMSKGNKSEQGLKSEGHFLTTPKQCR